MKGLIYPLAGLFAAAVVFVVVYFVVLAVSNQVKRDAIRSARWAAFTKVEGSGVAIVGVELVARWGHQEKVLKPSEVIARVSAEDVGGELLEAQARAEMRAGAYNSLR